MPDSVKSRLKPYGLFLHDFDLIDLKFGHIKIFNTEVMISKQQCVFILSVTRNNWFQC